MPMSLNMDCMAQIARIDIYMPIKTLLTLDIITTNQQYYNINLRAGPILAVLIHSLLCCSYKVKPKYRAWSQVAL